jgi:hypothetical protein
MRRKRGLTTPQLTLIRRYTHPSHFYERDQRVPRPNDWVQIAPGKWWPRDELANREKAAS